MKNLAVTLIFLSLFFGCKDEKAKSSTTDSTTKTEAKKSYTTTINFECETFFKKGDYADLCFTDSKLPEYMGRGCIFDFVIKGDKQEQSIKIQFAAKNSEALAEMSLNLDKNNYKEGIVTDISNLGDAAFLDVHDTDLKSLSISNKDLHVRYNNITFTLFVEYPSTSEKPCFYSDEELIAFAEIIIQNL